MPQTFGPIQGPGVSVTERDAQRPITPASLGWVAWAGIVERGPVGELIQCFSKADFLAQTGNLIADSHVPDCGRDFFDLSAGTGGILLVRITDGSEVPAQYPLYMRRATRTQLGYLEAHNGGRWGGYGAKYFDNVALVSDVGVTTLTTGVTSWAVDQWKGGYVELIGVPNTRYEIVGNSAAGVITVASDSDMDADLGVSVETGYNLILEQRADRGLEIELRDGENDPENEFSILVKLDATVVKVWENLSTATSSARYWVNIVNNDSSNYYVRAVDTWTGARPANTRPANYYSTYASLTATLLTADIHEFVIDGAGDPTMALGALTDDMVEQTLTITMTSATAGDVVSDKFGAVGSVTFGVAFAPDTKFVPVFTITAGGTPMVAADTITIVFKPLGPTNTLVGGFLFPDKTENPEARYNIIANTQSTITVSIGSDMATDVSGGGDEFMVQKFARASDGVDGHAGVDEQDYIAAFDTELSKFIQINGKNLGLVRFAVPGVTDVDVQRAAAAFVESGKVGSQEMRFEVPANVTTESAIYEFGASLGKSAYGRFVISAQSYGYVPDPEAPGAEKLISLTGAMQGREASIARSVGGYHKAAAGTTATLPRVVRLATGKQPLNAEYLYPRGINTIEVRDGQFVIWGNATFTSNTAWKSLHARRTMSYYINVLRENFDFAVFEINDQTLWGRLRSSLIGFFFGEYGKRALDNSFTFEAACVIKIDGENNTALTLSQQEVHADITIRLVNSADHVMFSIGKAGVIDSAA